MCGISGYITSDSELAVEFSAKASLLQQAIRGRGPDSFGAVDVVSGKLIAMMLHSRLSIIDTSSNSDQPYIGEYSKNVLTYNGEIYNCVELVQKFSIPEKYGYSDTSILYYLLTYFDTELCLKSISGMFSFTFYDEKNESFIVARDRFGEKPLYYSTSTETNSEYFLYSSDISAFYNFGPSSNVLKRAALEEFINFGYTLDNDTILSDVKEVPPGCFLQITCASELNVELKKYFDLNTSDGIITINGDNIQQLIMNCIKSSSVSDVKIGNFLSGGLDSTTIAAVTASATPTTAFTVAYGENDPELIIAKQNALEFKIDHEVIILDEKDLIPKLELYLEKITEPIGDDSGFLVDMVSGAAKNLGIKVLIGGDAGDELFFGYPRMLSALNIARKFKWFHYIRFPKKRKKSSKLGKLWDLNTTSLEQFYVNYFLNNSKTAWYNYSKTFAGTTEQRIRKVEVDLYLRKNGFKKLDYNTMLNGVEGRTPLANLELFRSVKLDDVSNVNLRRVLFAKTLENTYKNAIFYDEKSGFGIKNNQQICDYLFNENIHDDLLCNMFQVFSLPEKFDMNDFAINFRLRTLSKITKRYGLSVE